MKENSNSILHYVTILHAATVYMLNNLNNALFYTADRTLQTGGLWGKSRFDCKHVESAGSRFQENCESVVELLDFWTLYLRVEGWGFETGMLGSWLITLDKLLGVLCSPSCMNWYQHMVYDWLGVWQLCGLISCKIPHCRRLLAWDAICKYNVPWNLVNTWKKKFTIIGTIYGIEEISKHVSHLWHLQMSQIRVQCAIL